jgi:hypothetical protein
LTIIVFAPSKIFLSFKLGYFKITDFAISMFTVTKKSSELGLIQHHMERNFPFMLAGNDNSANFLLSAHKNGKNPYRCDASKHRVSLQLVEKCSVVVVEAVGSILSSLFFPIIPFILQLAGT